MAKLFQISEGDCGFTYKNKNYDFSDFDSIKYTYTQKNNLTRGANGQNKVGIAYKEDLKNPDIAEALIVDCSPEIYSLLNKIKEKQERISFWFVDRKTGEGLTYKNAIIADQPLQPEIGEGADKISFMLKVLSYDLAPKFNAA